jgi:uncharacterized protein YaiI (UPF0178 family)
MAFMIDLEADACPVKEQPYKVAAGARPRRSGE